MAAATRHDGQGNAIQVEGEGVEGEFHDAEGRGGPDDQGQGIPDPHNGCGRGRFRCGEDQDVGYSGYHPHHGLDPLHLIPWIS